MHRPQTTKNMAISESSTFLHMDAKDDNPYGDDDDMLGLMPPNELDMGLGCNSEPNLISVTEAADVSDVNEANITVGDNNINPRTESRDTFGGIPLEQNDENSIQLINLNTKNIVINPA